MLTLEDIAQLLSNNGYLVSQLEPDFLYIKTNMLAMFPGAPICLIQVKEEIGIIIYAHVDSRTTPGVIDVLKQNMMTHKMPKVFMTITELSITQMERALKSPNGG